MNAFRILLVVFIIAIISFTGVVIYNHGWNLLPIFFSDIVAMTWPGQFNFDFLCFLVYLQVVLQLGSCPSTDRLDCYHLGLLLSLTQDLSFLTPTLLVVGLLMDVPPRLSFYRLLGDLLCQIGGRQLHLFQDHDG